MPSNIIPIVVVDTKGRGFKKYMKVFRNVRYIDRVNSTRSNLLPKDIVVHDLGWGESFIEKYMKKHKLTKITV